MDLLKEVFEAQAQGVKQAQEINEAQNKLDTFRRFVTNELKAGEGNTYLTQEEAVNLTLELYEAKIFKCLCQMSEKDKAIEQLKRQVR